MHYYDSLIHHVDYYLPQDEQNATDDWARVTCPACLKEAPKPAPDPEPEQITIRQARALPEHVQLMREWFQALDQILYEDGDTRAFVEKYYPNVQPHVDRILFGYDVLVDNTCDPNLSYLDYKPEIKAAFDAQATLAGIIKALKLNPNKGLVNQCEHLKDELDELRQAQSKGK